MCLSVLQRVYCKAGKPSSIHTESVISIMVFIFSLVRLFAEYALVKGQRFCSVSSCNNFSVKSFGNGFIFFVRIYKVGKSMIVCHMVMGSKKSHEIFFYCYTKNIIANFWRKNFFSVFPSLSSGFMITSGFT